MTAEQIAQNRAAAVKAVRAALGLNETPSSWTLAQRERYNDALAQYILSRPEQFSDADLLSAELESKDAVASLDDERFSWSLFGTELAANATTLAEPIAGGFANAAAVSRYLIPVATVLGVLVAIDQLTAGGVRKFWSK